MGQSESQNNIQQQYDIVKLREDGSALLHHKRTQDQFLLRTVSSNVGEEIIFFQDMLKKRQHIRSSHLLDLMQIRKKQQKNVCSVVHKLYLLIEFPFKTLKEEMMDKISHTKAIPFLEAELWSILYSCCQGLYTLYSKKMPHESLTSNQIYINKEGIIKIADPIILGLEKNYIKVLKNSDQHVQISPEIINFIDDCNFSFYDKEKSDVFILGVIMVQASLLRPLHLFDQKSKKPYLDIIPAALREIRQKYNESYCSLLQKMLQLHSKLRPKFQDLINMIEHDASLYESTDQASVQHLPQNSNQYLNSKNCKSQKTLPRQGMAKNGQEMSGKNGKTMNRMGSANLQVNPYNNQSNQYETIIKMLQTENLARGTNQNRTYFPPPNGMQQQSFHQHINQKVYNNQANRMSGTQVFSQTPQNNFVPFMKPEFNQAQQVNSNSLPPSARFVDANERFSYTKFGNITLPTQVVHHHQHHHQQQQQQYQQQQQHHHHQQQQYQQSKQHKPIYSYEIPEINQILNKNKPTHKSNLSGSKPKQQDLRLQHGEENYQQIKKEQNTKNFMAQNQGVISLKKTQNNPNPEKSKNIYIAAQQYKKLDEDLDRIEMASTWTQYRQGQNTTFDSRTKQTKMPNQNQNKNQTKISLNGLLKQNSGNKNQIFAVTQKTQQHMDTSPGRANFKIQSGIKLKQPQRSPNFSPSVPSKHSSAQKQLQFPQDQQPKYTVLEIEGGGRYQGFIKNGMKNGQGKLEFNDGGYYVGQWKDNKMHGVGKLHYQNGQVAYQGDWDNDQFCGFGRVFNDRPEKLIGAFNYYDFADLGEKWIYYEGQFKNDSKHGKGKIRLTNGEVFQGNFVFDSIEGQGIFYTNKGEAIRGSWRDNMLIES